LSNELRIGRHYVAEKGATYHAYRSAMGEFAACGSV
jgi:hypothetical protein